MKIALRWQPSSFTGWGVYGLNLAMEWANDPIIEAMAAYPLDLKMIDLDALRSRAIKPFVVRSFKSVSPVAIALDALGNDMVGATDAPIGVIFFEEPLSLAAIERARRYEIIVTGSTWNEEVLRGHGLTNVKTIFQGVDRSLFHPAPKRHLYPDKFLIFSGGKAEPRKGQDLVVKAFRAFAARHGDAMLVTAWASPWPQLANGMDLDLTGFEDRVIHLAATANSRMAPVYRECDVALFPNRAEGGTNLVAMECTACGVPAIISSNTGHRDLRKLPNVYMLSRQTAVPGNWSEWGESDVDEIVEVLETAYRARWVPSIYGIPYDRFEWSETASRLAAIAREHQRRSHHERESRKVESHG